MNCMIKDCENEAQQFDSIVVNNERVYGPLCNTHTDSIKEDVEEWRQVVGWPKYEISESGRVRRMRNGLGIIHTFLIKGYLAFNVIDKEPNRKSLRVHREVAKSFIGVGRGIVRHKDGNPLNNHYTNLAWGTHKDNEADKRAHGRIMDGEKNHQHKLTLAEVIMIRMSTASGVSLARQFGTSRSNISRIRKGQSWRNL